MARSVPLNPSANQRGKSRRNNPAALASTAVHTSRVPSHSTIASLTPDDFLRGPVDDFRVKKLAKHEQFAAPLVENRLIDGLDRDDQGPVGEFVASAKPHRSGRRGDRTEQPES